MSADSHARRRYEIGRMFVLAILVLAVWATAYNGRRDLVKSQRAACARAKLDRAANARGWRVAEYARNATANDPSVSPSERSTARHAAVIYGRTAAGLERRARINCSKLFPDPPTF